MSGQHSSSSAALAVACVCARCHWRMRVLQAKQQRMQLVGATGLVYAATRLCIGNQCCWCAGWSQVPTITRTWASL
jgi:hypothetical protein